MDLSIVLPSYNEEENLKVLIPKIVSEMDRIAIKYEVLVIDTRIALDNTKTVCEINGVNYMNRIDGDNYGDAIRTGIMNAKGKKIIIMDADGSHDPRYLGLFVEYSQDYDLVIGSRYVSGGKTENNFILIFLSLIVNIMYRIVLSTHLKDISNSYRMYNLEKLKRLDLTCDNFDIVEEILMKLILMEPNLLVKEIPIEFKKRLFGNSKRQLIKFAFSYFATMLRLYKIKRDFMRRE